MRSTSMIHEYFFTAMCTDSFFIAIEYAGRFTQYSAMVKAAKASLLKYQKFVKKHSSCPRMNLVSMLSY